MLGCLPGGRDELFLRYAGGLASASVVCVLANVGGYLREVAWRAPQFKRGLSAFQMKRRVPQV
jgi:hypothetical protein